MDLDDLHATLVRDVLAGSALTRDAALDWMAVLISQRIRLRAPVTSGRSSLTEVSALPWRRAAELIARLWREADRGAEAYADYVAPYLDYCRELGANAIDDVPEPRRSQITALRDRLSAHPAVAAVEPEP